MKKQGVFQGRESMKEKYQQLEEDYKELLRQQQEHMTELTELRYNKLDYANSRKEMEELHEHARRLKHDMRNHLMVIASYLNAGETEEARCYTSQILDKLNLEYSYIETGNTLLNFIVNQKFSVAKELGIYVRAEIENLRFEQVQSIDFSAILGNLLDNAIEHAQHSKEKCMELVIRKVKGHEVITVSNSIDASVLTENPKLQTTKSDTANHGVGLGEIREIADKYGVLLDIYEHGGRFFVSVYF